ncbi:octaprenyl diphosphate synthase [Candidatus Kinetoplastibacterium blastocrithidii TCC012E]|uniref:Octaprenyl diphosphate synthase n=1 Tax=Candidatus Kinetoplastidibacterium blastocrithidiae TCC012E TaxID=1208922 RepID=M1M4M9_9PROT|nr:polyprenyl synthetase family protein [Candidatus Kinetoplastibacterium blastocrithidii]AGF50049.1 octaprenyl diphosphate synthase [Candidatus Kinetoplastibacterium blastocrithidii TCC012E]
MKSISDDLKEVDKIIREQLNSEVALVRAIGDYIINSGGKRIRPSMVLVIALSLGYKGNKHHLLAAIIEFIHTATLLHDDVVDESELRRGLSSANSIFGNAASVLVGDYLYSKSFEMMVSTDSLRIMDILSKTTTVIAEGEVLQLMNIRDPDASFESYMQVVRFKTAKLFEASAHVGAIIANADLEQENSAIAYGRHIGTSFQLIDDILDYFGDVDTLGKNIGDDLREGKLTLPLIRAMAVCSEKQRNILRDAVLIGDANLVDIIDIVKDTDALQYTSKLAECEAKEAQKSILNYPCSSYKEILMELPLMFLNRIF